MSAVELISHDPAAAGFGHRLTPPGQGGGVLGRDPLSGATFEAIWEKTLRPDLTALEQDRQRSVLVFLIALMAGGLAAWSEWLFLPIAGTRLAFEGPFFTVLLGGSLGFLPLARTAAKAKGDMIAALTGPMGVAYHAGGQPPAFDAFLRLNLLPHPSDRRFADFLLGRRGKVTFTLCQAKLWQGSGRSRTLAFNGQLLQLTTGRTRTGVTAVLRNGFLAGFACPSGLSRVGLEDPRFSKIFEAFGSDQVEAREILTPAFMQRLVELESGYAGEKLRCAFTGADILIAIEGGDCFKFGSLFTSFADRSRAEAIARDLEQLFGLMDSFAEA